MFGTLPHEIKRLPMSEFRVLVRYYLKTRSDLEKARDQGGSVEPTDGVVIG